MSRLNSEDWETLKSQITQKGLVIVALDLPTSHQFMKVNHDEFTQRMLSAINGMMLDMLAAVYEDRRRRQAEGIAKAKASGKYKGRPKNTTLRRNIAALLRDHYSINEIVKALQCSNKTVISVKKEITQIP